MTLPTTDILGYDATTDAMTTVNVTEDLSNVTTIAAPAGMAPYFTYSEFKIAMEIDKKKVWVCLFLGILGNLSSVVVLAKMRPFGSSLLYMLVLSLVDSSALILRFAYFVHPLEIEVTLHYCRFMHYVINIVQTYSNWIVVFMTAERLLAVRFPMQVSKWCTLRNAVITLLVSALLFLLMMIIHLVTITVNTRTRGGITTYMCSVHPDYNEMMFKKWHYFDSAIYGFIPVVLVITCNTLIIWQLRQSRRQQAAMTGSGDTAQAAEKNREQRQITRMLLTVAIVFVVFTLPNAIMYVEPSVWDVWEDQHALAKYILARVCLASLTDLNNAVNFYLYLLSGRKFRTKFLEVVFCRKAKPRAVSYTGTSKLAYKTANGSGETTGVSYISDSQQSVST